MRIMRAIVTDRMFAKCHNCLTNLKEHSDTWSLNGLCVILWWLKLLLIHYMCFGANERENNKINGMVFQMVAIDRCTLCIPSWCIFLWICFFLVSLVLLAWDGTLSLSRLHRSSSSYRRACPDEVLQEGLLFLLAQSQEFGGHKGIHHYTRRAAERHQPTSNTSIYSFVRWGAVGTLLEP